MATGDTQAATALVRRYQARVYGLARTIVRESALAEEIAQEAFVRAWRHAAAYDARRGAVPAWLLTITRNLALDALRIRREEPVDPAVLMTRRLRGDRRPHPRTGRRHPHRRRTRGRPASPGRLRALPARPGGHGRAGGLDHRAGPA